MLLHRDGLVVAHLRFGTNAEIDEHDAPMDIDAICVSGTGFVSLDGQHFPFEAGQSVLWPKSSLHKLWTTSDRMETIMVERIYQS